MIARVFLPATVTIATIAAATVWIVPKDGDLEALFDHNLHDAIAADHIADADGLLDKYFLERERYLRITPPTTHEFVQPVGVTTFDADALPEKLTANLIPETCAPLLFSYRAYLGEQETSSGRRWFVLNGDSELVWVHAAPADYDPFAELAERNPELAAAAATGDPEAVEEWDELKTLYDPARLVIAVDLLQAEDAIKYVWAESLYAPVLAETTEEGGAPPPAEPERGGGLRIDGVSIVDDQLQLTWQSESGMWYRVAGKSDLTRSVDFVSLIVASNTACTFNLDIGASQTGFHYIMEDNGGATIWTDGSVSGVTTVIVTVRPTGDPVEYLALLDVTGGETNILGVVYGTNITEYSFSIDTAEMPNCDRDLQVVAFEGSPDPEKYVSEISTVTVENNLFIAPNYPETIGWKLVGKFGTTLTDGSYLVEIDSVDSGVTSAWGFVSGSLAEADAEGYISFEDTYVWDETINDYRFREWFDDYGTIEAFDVTVTVDGPAGAQAPHYEYKWRLRTSYPPAWRISTVCEDTDALPYVEVSLDRQIMDGLFDVNYMSMAYVSAHYDWWLNHGESDQLPGTHGWTRFAGPDGWVEYNLELATHPTGVYESHMTFFGHGSASTIGDAGPGFGPEHEVSPTTLAAFGFAKSNGLSFAFFDACEVQTRPAVLPNLLMRNGGVHGVISGTDFGRLGLHANFSCGWDKNKMISFAGHVYVDHITYSSNYMTWLVDPDPVTGAPQWNYEEVRERARLRSWPGGNVNPAASGYDRTGYEQGYVHW